MATESLVGATVAGCAIEAIVRHEPNATVYRARHVALGRRVALTVLGPQSAQDRDARERLIASAALEHPHIVPVIESDESGGALYLLTEWIDGVDLRARLSSRGPLDPDEALRILGPVASALAAAHRQGLVHGDVSSANVLIADADAGVYLTGLGVARPTGETDGDISAFGELLLEALTGRAAEEPELENGALRDGPLGSLIARATTPDPAARPQSADELVLAIERARAAARAAPLAPGRRIDERVAQTDSTPIDEPEAPATPGPRRVTRLTAAIALPVLAVVLIVALATYNGTRRSNAYPAAYTGTRHSHGHATTPTRIATVPGHTAPTRTTPVSPPLPLAAVTQGHLTIGREIALGGPAAGLSVAPSGVAWVAVPARNELVAVAPNQPPHTFGGIPSPGPIAAGGAGVWVTDPATSSVALFAGGQLKSPTALPARPVAVALDPSGNSAWVADSAGGLSHVRAHGGAAAAGAHVTAHIAAPVSGLAVGEPHWVWSADGSLVRTDPVALRSVIFDAGAGTDDVTLNQGIWTAHADGTVSRFDPRPGHRRDVATVAAPGPISRIASRERSPFVWAISGSARGLYQIAIAQQAIVGVVRFNSPPTAVAVTHLGVWVTTAGGSLIRIKR